MADVKVKIDWQGKKFEKSIENLLVSRLGTIGSLLRRDVVKTISRPFRGGGGGHGGRNKLGQFKRGGSQWRFNPKRKGTPSKPGEPPKADLGRLRQSVFSRVDKKRLNVAVGVTVKYGLALELGSRRMRPRPYLRPSFNRNMPQIKDIIVNGAKKKGRPI